MRRLTSDKSAGESADSAGADDRDLIVKAYMSEDFREGMEVFLGKRKPAWKP